MNPSPDSNIIPFPKPVEAERMENRKTQDSLKELASGRLDTFSYDQVQELLQNIVTVEDFLFSTTNPAEDPKEYGRKYQRIYRQVVRNRPKHKGPRTEMRDPMLRELKETIGGMINFLPKERVEWLWDNRDKFLDFINQSVTPVPSPMEVADFESEEKLFHSLSAVAMGFMSKIRLVRPAQYLKSIKAEYLKNGLNVEVRFFAEDNENYVLVSATTKGREVGIVVPRQGTKLDMTMAFDLFGSDKEGTVLSPATIASFPQVENRVIDYKSDDKSWRVLKIGELKG